MASYIQILTSRIKNQSAANRPSPTYAPPPPPPAVIETPPPAAPEVVEAVVELPTVEETPAPSDEKPEETEAPCENTDSEIV